ncbi:hypothetical protein H072_1906 [Dactylellina haptotyla CBS 200.50]|uniref:Transcription initiation factor TFIID subunit 8 n=1 Tax=Dactylellina haptotyla (strain CBS 200.50) TaxID=1284197 RepID=S8ASY6_DACHA|nr:hypothetical protein H072_1906 [Dactylellina haptotyla CBS 200.50]
MAPDILGLGPPSKKRRVSPDGEAADASADSSRMAVCSDSQRRKKLPPIARQSLPADAAPVLPAEIVEPLFEQSIALVLKSCGFDGGNKLALNSIRHMAGQYLQDITTNAMTYCATQRRTRPTVTDFEETLKNTGFNAADLEDEIIRYRKSQTRLTPSDASNEAEMPLLNGNTIKKQKPHIYTLPNPDPAPPEEPSLLELLGPELLKPRKRYKLPLPTRPAWMAKLEQDHPNNLKFAAPTKQAVSVQTERPYIDPHHPPWPGKHTYERHEVVEEVVRDAKKIRELASEEARQSGETLRKLLAEFSKVSTAVRKGDANGGTTTGTGRKSASEIYKGGNARRKRDEMFEKTWETVIKGLEAEKEKEKTDREEKKRQRKEQREKALAAPVNGLFGSSSAMEIDFDESSGDESVDEEAEKETQIDDKGLLDTVVNCEKSLWAKGGMRRVMIR